MNKKACREAAILYLIFAAVVLTVSAACFGLTCELIIMATHDLNSDVVISFLAIGLLGVVAFVLGFVSIDCAWPWVCRQLEEMFD